MSWQPGRRTAAVLAVLAAVAVAAVGLWLWVGRDRGAERTAAEPTLAPAAAATHARRACELLAEFENLVDVNAPAKRARKALADAVTASKEAADADPRWVVLSSGTQTVELAISSDDASAAEVGISVVRQECTRTGASPAP